VPSDEAGAVDVELLEERVRLRQLVLVQPRLHDLQHDLLQTREVQGLHALEHLVRVRVRARVRVRVGVRVKVRDRDRVRDRVRDRARDRARDRVRVMVRFE
jgi:hypothetical protein